MITTARAFFAAYTAHDVPTMLTLCANGAQIRYVPLGEQGVGSAVEVGAGLWKSYIEAFPNFRSEVTRLRVSEEERSIVCEVVNSGTQAKEVAGIANRGRTFHVPHLFILDFDLTYKISHMTCYWDSDTLYSQLGHTQPHP